MFKKAFLLGAAIAALIAAPAFAQVAGDAPFTPGAGGHLGVNACGTVSGNTEYCPAQSSLCQHTIPISTGTTATTDIYTSSQKVHFCAIFLDASVTEPVGIIEGAGSGCPTPSNILPSTTLYAGQATPLVSGIPFAHSATALDHICITVGVGSGQSTPQTVTGFITYADY